MSPKKVTQESDNSTAAAGKPSGGFSAEERAAMKVRAQELKAATAKADEESAVLAKIAEMSEPDRAKAERLHAIIKASAPLWWAAVTVLLAQVAAASPALDPLGPNAGPHDVPLGLLHAALDLLAWAQACWPDLAPYGLKDRLPFLWQWGSSRGLGRLV